MRAVPLVSLFVVGWASCTAEAPLVAPDGCQPLLGDLSCTLPYPSDFFRQGGVVAMHGAGKPQTPTGIDADLVTPLGVDGFSRQPEIVGVLPDTVASDGLPNVVDDPTRSLDIAASPTLLLRADTGELVAHYVDVDPSPDDPTHVALMMRTFVQLAPGVRYIVAFRGVKNQDGALARAAEGFRRLRDHDTARDPALATLAPRFESDVFGVLASRGVVRGDLQLAWDFTTATASTAESDMLDMRALVLAWLAQNTPVVTIASNGPDTGSGEYSRVVTGTVTVPLYLDKASTGGRLFRGSDGKVAQNGTTDAPFLAVVPTTVTAAAPGRALAFGHGFFGGTDEVQGAQARLLISTLQAVTFAIDWWGMAKDDLGTVLGLITGTPSRTGEFPERVYQAMANWMVMTNAMRTSLTTQDALKDTPGGTLLYDPSHLYYFGASMGHILGSVMCALDPDIERAAFSVGGASWEQMIPRASPFAGFNFFIKSTMGDELSTKLLEAMLASAVDRIDPATYAPYLLGAKLPGNPDRRIIMQTGIGDAEVPNVASFFQARQLGLSMVSPSPESVWNVPLADASTLTSAITVWDYGIDPNVYRIALPPPANAVHTGLRNVPAAMQQMDAFLKPNGTVIDACTGPCKAP